ncbi:MAG TPA: ABC transporter permease [Gemmatimonadota bacterium]|nr:ABC transporter permease [Gemmatimonadota bacterium]
MLGRRPDREIEEELAFHLEMRTAELIEAGESPERARERAMARFGDVAEARAHCAAIAKRRERKMARTEYVEDLRQDLRFAFRTLVRNRAFTALALATLVLGIGATSAIFSVVNGVLLRPLPFPAPERVVHWGWGWAGGEPSGALSAYKLEWFRERSSSFEAVATYRSFTQGLGTGPEEAVSGLRVTRPFLRVVGHPLPLGRWFTAEEATPGGPDVVVLGHGLWQARFGADPGIVGRDVTLGGVPRTVIGVMSPGFRFPQSPDAGDVFVPLRLEADPQDEGHNHSALARLAPGVDRGRASAELTTLSARFRDAHPELMGERERGMGLISYQDLYVGSLRGVLWILLGAVGLVLLIACANVANLLLARTSERQREIAVRSAMGASRGRLIRQILTESVALSLVAGALGFGLATWATRALVAAAPWRLPRAEEIGPDATVVLFTFGAAVITAVVFGLVAALPSAGRGPMIQLREGSHGTPPGRRLRAALVTTEAALSLVLLIGAGLLISTLLELRAVDPGFESDGLLTASVPRWPDRYDSDATLAAFESRLLDRLSPARGDTDPSSGGSGAGPIQAMALAGNIPLERGWNLPMEVEGRPDAREGDVEWRGVSPGYFETVGTPLVRGRTFTAADDADAPRVVIVNEEFVRLYLPDTDPIGQRVALGRFRGRWIHPEFAGEPAEIVGVVADMRELSLRRDPKRTMLVPRSQAPSSMRSTPVFLLRTARPGAAAATLRRVLAGIDPSLPPPTFRPMDEIIGESLARERFNALLMGLFSAIALVLTAIGIFGVVSYGVRRRTREIGIRMALGARTRDVTRMVTWQGMLPVAIGLAIGIAAALGLTRLLQTMIWGVSATDPVTFVAVTAVMATVALLASWVPARRAARAEPMRALRQE